MVTKLDDWYIIEHTSGVQYKASMFKRIYIAFDQEQIRTVLDREEATPRDIDTMRIIEMFDCSPRGGFKLGDMFNDRSIAVIANKTYLDYRMPFFCDLGIYDDIQIHRLFVHNAL